MDEFMETPTEQEEEILTVDFMAREQLSEAARWARFLAIMGFIGCGLLVIVGVSVSLFYYNLNHMPVRYGYTYRTVNNGFGRMVFIGIVYAIMAVVCFFSCLYLYRFAGRMKEGLHERSQDQVNESFRNLKKMFRYNGILTIVMVAFYIVMLFAGMIAFLNR